MTNLTGIDVRGPVTGRDGEIRTAAALAFAATRQRECDPPRGAAQRRAERHAELDAGALSDRPYDRALRRRPTP